MGRHGRSARGVREAAHLCGPGRPSGGGDAQRHDDSGTRSRDRRASRRVDAIATAEDVAASYWPPGSPRMVVSRDDIGRRRISPTRRDRHRASSGSRRRATTSRSPFVSRARHSPGRWLADARRRHQGRAPRPGSASPSNEATGLIESGVCSLALRSVEKGSDNFSRPAGHCHAKVV